MLIRRIQKMQRNRGKEVENTQNTKEDKSENKMLNTEKKSVR
jgi:hypothetical protein